MDKIKGAELLEKVQVKRSVDMPRSPTFMAAGGGPGGEGGGFLGTARHEKQGSIGGSSLADRLGRFAQRDRS